MMLQGIKEGIKCMKVVLFQMVSNWIQHSTMKGSALLECGWSFHVHELTSICKWHSPLMMDYYVTRVCQASELSLLTEVVNLHHDTKCVIIIHI